MERTSARSYSEQGARMISPEITALSGFGRSHGRYTLGRSVGRAPAGGAACRRRPRRLAIALCDRSHSASVRHTQGTRCGECNTADLCRGPGARRIAPLYTRVLSHRSRLAASRPWHRAFSVVRGTEGTTGMLKTGAHALLATPFANAGRCRPGSCWRIRGARIMHPVRPSCTGS